VPSLQGIQPAVRVGIAAAVAAAVAAALSYRRRLLVAWVVVDLLQHGASSRASVGVAASETNSRRAHTSARSDQQGRRLGREEGERGRGARPVVDVRIDAGGEERTINQRPVIDNTIINTIISK
jgi:hypothetical protein